MLPPSPLRIMPDRRGWWLLAACAFAGATATAWYVTPSPDGSTAAPVAVRPIPAAAPPAVEPTRLRPLDAAEARVVNAAAALTADAGPAALPFTAALAGAGALPGDRATDCLAAAAFYEAGDDAEGERAVVQVVLNRVRHPAFPKSVCGVVLQGAERRTGCQFTFTCDGSMTRRVPSPPVWTRARAIAAEALAGAVYAPVGLATHYHADYVVPYWAARLDRVARVGSHLFYRWGGWWGSPRAFNGRPTGAEAVAPALMASRAAAGLVELHDGTVVARGAALRPGRASADDPDLFLVKLSGGAAAYRLRAEALCRGRATCTVLGWTDARRVARALPLSPEQIDALAFRYVRLGDGEATPLWDCSRTPRPSVEECLPRRGLLAAARRTTAAPLLASAGTGQAAAID